MEFRHGRSNGRGARDTRGSSVEEKGLELGLQGEGTSESVQPGGRAVQEEVTMSKGGADKGKGLILVLVFNGGVTGIIGGRFFIV